MGRFTVGPLRQLKQAASEDGVVSVQQQSASRIDIAR